MDFTHYNLLKNQNLLSEKKKEMWGQFVAISGSLLALFCATLVFLSVCGKLSPLAFKAEAGGNIKSKIGLWSSVINGRIFFFALRSNFRWRNIYQSDQTKLLRLFSLLLRTLVVSKVLEGNRKVPLLVLRFLLFTGCPNKKRSTKVIFGPKGP